MENQVEVIEDKEVFTVHALNQAARRLLEAKFQTLWVKGELSNVALPRSGHIYFTLKDQHAQVRCAMFKGNNRRLNFTPTDGMEVLVQASVSLYEERGDYQLIVGQMEKGGLGQLQQAFEALKTKLKIEGLFELAAKKPFPPYPRHIGVVTSQTGAAIQDILSVLKRRYPIAPVTIYHTQVQGKAATPDIIRAIEFANRQQQVDVILLARGGGSLEDLWCFNEEAVARAIYSSQIPIVSGIGHEVDFTIADFVADFRAPTPSAAAETITPDSTALSQLFQHKEAQLLLAMQRELRHYALKVDSLEKQLLHPGEKLKKAFLQCDHLQQKLVLLIQQQWALAKQKLAHASASLHTVSPLATLGRGYAIVTTPMGQIIQDVAQLAVGDKVKTLVAKGSFISQVAEVLD